ncbi:PAS domain-containing protein, partial [Xanthobacter autotrophicus]
MPVPEGKDFLADSPLALASGAPDFGAVDAEEAWIAVIRKMDETYAELVRQQVELEEKNAALEEAQGFIAGLLGSMTDVLIACDLAGRVEQVNLAAERVFGQLADALTGRPLAALLDLSL